MTFSWTGRVIIGVLLMGMGGCVCTGLRPVTASGSVTTDAEVDPADATLRWQTFPRKEDQAIFGPGMKSRISNVRYDLKIWTRMTPHGWAPTPTLVTGLAKPEYRMGFPVPGQPSRWAARATFDLDGKPRVTQWTSITPPSSLWDSPLDHPVARIEGR